MRRAACPACGSGARVKSDLPRRLSADEITRLCRKTELSEKEVQALYARFRKVVAPSTVMTLEKFKGSLGILALGSDPFLPDALFRVFSGGKKDHLEYEDYISNLGIMLRGTEDEKLALSYGLAAKEEVSER